MMAHQAVLCGHQSLKSLYPLSSEQHEKHKIVLFLVSDKFWPTDGPYRLSGRQRRTHDAEGLWQRLHSGRRRQFREGLRRARLPRSLHTGLRWGDNTQSHEALSKARVRKCCNKKCCTNTGDHQTEILMPTLFHFVSEFYDWIKNNSRLWGIPQCLGPATLVLFVLLMLYHLLFVVVFFLRPSGYK